MCVVACVGGCTSATTGDETIPSGERPTVGSVRESGTAIESEQSAGSSGASLPVAASQPAGTISIDVSPADAAVLGVAVEDVVAECMARSGFQYIALDLATATAISEAETANRRVDLPINPGVEGTGYQPLAEVPSRTFDNDAYARSLGESERQAWANAGLGSFDDVTTVVLPGGISFDIPNDGCLTEGRTTVFGSIEAALGFEAGLSRVRIDAHGRTTADEAVVAAMTEWSACMLERTGQQFRDFSQARRIASEDPTRSLSIAEADAACTIQTGLRDVYVSVLAANTQVLIDENLPLLEQYSESISDAIARALS